jgi:hypothetical protein
MGAQPLGAWRARLGENSGVLRGGILVGTKDIEVADDDRLKTINASEAAHVVLARELTHCVGKNGIGGDMSSRLGSEGWSSKRQFGIDDTADSGLAGGDKDVERSIDVFGVGGDRAPSGGSWREQLHLSQQLYLPESPLVAGYGMLERLSFEEKRMPS